MAQDDFLKVLITQMTTQDPLNPVKDADFMGQMAQFSALEQTRAMGQEISLLRGDQERLQASALLGHTVATRGEGDSILTGTVDAIVLEDGAPKLLVNNNTYSLSEVIRVNRNFEPEATV